MRSARVTDPATGRFVKTSQPWSFENWDEGRINNRGRFIVYLPDYPRSYPGGRCLRTHAVWWLTTGQVVPEGWDLHHKDENKLNDKFENLELVVHGEHSRRHQKARRKQFPTPQTCETCSKQFLAYPAKQRRYCSLSCRRNRSVAARVEALCDHCGGPFSHAPWRKRRFCSPRCSALSSWFERKSKCAF